MARPFIVVGDRLSHGGSVLAGSSQSDINGKQVARVGDRAVCVMHGPTTIVSGDASVVIDGQPVARDGDQTGCGATLVASQTATGLR
ncbi:PAAR domain-containing protein [Stenotrophomonas sp. 24(2023)]|uniref:PAAR domain-containing protein n=1 Tax=Stenotrophomonas sp. 24(2023) TaxID=3068324 RepID=UPI0027E195B0|nr:PAAR domain-containing protein [Stenotrophomonas sp. 24(2023)]WMJ69527.1 PAAR domain-containing protein [Stenotrophomonas sp. 24(2023)]